MHADTDQGEPEGGGLAAGESRVELRDGSHVVVRSIRPGDREVIRAGFNKLSPDSRYARFLAPIEKLTEAQLTYLTEVDGHDHAALVAFDPGSGEGVGVARFVREPQTARAEAAVTVIDDWQGRGLGTALTRLLAERAREEDVGVFTATLLAGNEPMRALLAELGPHRTLAADGPVVEIEVTLPDEGVGDHITGVLRIVARGDAELATPPGIEGSAGGAR